MYYGAPGWTSEKVSFIDVNAWSDSPSNRRVRWEPRKMESVMVPTKEVSSFTNVSGGRLYVNRRRHSTEAAQHHGKKQVLWHQAGLGLHPSITVYEVCVFGNLSSPSTDENHEGFENTAHQLRKALWVPWRQTRSVKHELPHIPAPECLGDVCSSQLKGKE